MPTASTWLARSRVPPRHGGARLAADRRPAGLIARIGQVIDDRRRRRAERAAATLIERNGGHLTDSIERRIGDGALRG